mmetsp:Transcript_13278/g.18207  ORF Transcript_13278/g.18207 Transcript_13278/m.18207 type:complete len:160 (+) Transcript_13278:3201-3680(+)
MIRFFGILIILLLTTVKALQNINIKHAALLLPNRIRSVIMKRKALDISVDSMDMYQGISEAFVGGTVGVMSVMFMLEVKKKEDLSLESCPYCMGNGEILCASCCGCGVLANNSCSVCGGIGLVTCINCKGDGRITPILLQSRAVRDPEFAVDGISIDSP